VVAQVLGDLRRFDERAVAVKDARDALGRVARDDVPLRRDRQQQHDAERRRRRQARALGEEPHRRRHAAARRERASGEEEQEVDQRHAFARQQNERAHRRQHHEVRRVRVQPLRRQRQRQQHVRRRRAHPRLAAEEPRAEEVDEQRGGAGDRDQRHADRVRVLPENRFDQRVRRVRPRELHVVDEPVRRDALQQELAGVRVLAFVALEREVEVAEADDGVERDDEPDEDLDRQRRRLPLLLHSVLYVAVAGSVAFTSRSFD
jgi:hypothetical protein